VQFCEKKEYHVQTRRAKRVYTKYQKAAFLDKLFNKNLELHAMLRQPKCTQPTPLTQPAWNAYLNRHFRPSAARGVQLRGLEVGSGLSARDLVVPLGRNPPPHEVLLQQGAQNDWMLAPGTIDPPSSNTMLALVAEQIGKMNGRASPGFDCVAASFIKYAVVVWPKPDGRGSERVNVIGP